MVKYSTKTNDVEFMLLGDFNARTASVVDFIESNDVQTDGPGMSDLITTYGIKRYRASTDSETNSYCNPFIQFCISQNLLIVNGRVAPDANVGKCTCSDVSTVDYVVASPSLLCKIEHFCIEDFDELLSDRHSPIHFVYNVIICDIFENDNSNVNANSEVRSVWVPENKQVFIDNIDLAKIDAVKQRLEACLVNGNDSNQMTINEVTSDVTKILIDAADKSSMIKTFQARSKKKIINSSSKKLPWFDHECSRKRNILRRARKIHAHIKTARTERARNNAYKTYKITLNRKFRSYYSLTHAKLRQYKKGCGKKYWRILNNCLKSPESNNIPTSDIFFSTF